RPRLSAEEERSLTALDETGQEKPTLDNALGLLDAAQRTRAEPPRKHNVVSLTPAALALLQSLDDLVHEHRETPVKIKARPANPDEPWMADVNPNEEILLGNLQWQI